MWFSDVLVEHNELFWTLFSVDMDRCLENVAPEYWDIFEIFTTLNNYLLSDGTYYYYPKSSLYHCYLLEIINVGRFSLVKTIWTRKIVTLIDFFKYFNAKWRSFTFDFTLVVNLEEQTIPCCGLAMVKHLFYPQANN